MASIYFCNKEQLSIVQALAHEIWPQVYDYMISPAQIDYMLSKMYSLESLENQWHEGHQFIILENIKPIGFASYEFYDGKGMKLHKLYLLKAAHGKGWGKMLLNKVSEEGRTHDKEWLELNVNRSNTSLHFYKSQGFTIQDSVDISIGEGFEMNDYIMVKSLI
jgi:diamine N-acetyltransferase